MAKRNLGTFEGYNLRDQRALDRKLKLTEVLGWDHETQGGVEFRPAGDCPALALLFAGRNAVTAVELRAVADLLEAVNRKTEDTLLRLHVLVNRLDADLQAVTAVDVRELRLTTYRGTTFEALRRKAGLKVLKQYWSPLYAFMETVDHEGLGLDLNKFLDTPTSVTEEIRLGLTCVLLVRPRG